MERPNQHLLRTHQRAQFGFTLIEILLVVGIIAFLATLVATNIFRDKTTADIKSARIAVKQIETEAQRYYVDTGSMPTQLDDLLHPPKHVQNWQGPYITPSKALDPWKQAYVLKFPGTHGQLDVMSLGMDGKEGGTDAAADIGSWE